MSRRFLFRWLLPLANLYGLSVLVKLRVRYDVLLARTYRRCNDGVFLFGLGF